MSEALLCQAKHTKYCHDRDTKCIYLKGDGFQVCGNLIVNFGLDRIREMGGVK